MYVYAEVLLLENLIINFIILYVTKKFTKTSASIFRMFLAALIGALYCLVVFYPSLLFLTRFIMKVSISILMIIIAFNPVRFKKFIKLIATFYVVSFVFAGACIALFYLTDVKLYSGKGIFYIYNFSLKILIFAVVISWVLIKVTWGYIQNKISKNKIFIPITIKLNNKKINIKALVDTANSLKDPLTGTPVIIVQFSVIKELLPSKTQEIFNKYNENNLDVIASVMSSSASEIKFRLIPFKSLGKENGMLLGFIPDKVIIEGEDKKIINEIIIGIYNNTLSKDDEYSALLHPEVLN